MSAFDWRPATADDVAALGELARACDAHDGTRELLDAAWRARIIDWPLLAGSERAVCMTAAGDAVGVTAVVPSGGRIFLAACVAPAARAQLEREALARVVERGLAIAAPGSELRFDRVRAPGSDQLPRSTTAIYRGLGFARKYVELELTRALERVSVAPSPDGIAIARWSASCEPALREAYNDAFSTRGFAGYSEDVWQTERFSAQDGFLPSCSFVARAGGEVVAFAMCLREGAEGWIDSAGVRPAWRGRGIADAVLIASMAAMRDAGLTTVVLRVNEDNPAAMAVYRRLGFAPRCAHEVWSRLS